MSALSTSGRENLAKRLSVRQESLPDGIRASHERMHTEGCADLLSGALVAGGQSLAKLLTDVTNAEAARDAAARQEIFVDETRLAVCRSLTDDSSRNRRSRMKNVPL